MFDSLFRLGLDATMLGFEAQSVAGLRLLRLAGGGAVAQAEAHRMVAEKGAAFVEAAATLATGGSAAKVLRRYRTHVRNNKRRLTRRKSRKS
jgi:hypothetical protein